MRENRTFSSVRGECESISSTRQEIIKNELTVEIMGKAASGVGWEQIVAHMATELIGCLSGCMNITC